jgi:hypothetical protein
MPYPGNGLGGTGSLDHDLLQTKYGYDEKSDGGARRRWERRQDRSVQALIGRCRIVDRRLFLRKQLALVPVVDHRTEVINHYERRDHENRKTCECNSC